MEREYHDPQKPDNARSRQRAGEDRGGPGSPPVIYVQSEEEIEVLIKYIAPYNGITCISAGGKARVTLQSIHLSKNWGSAFQGEGAVNVSVMDSQISNNYRGLEVRGSATLSLINTTVVDTAETALLVYDTASLSVIDSRISRNGSGFRVTESANWSDEVKVRGTPSKMRENGIDLCGFAPASLRTPLIPQTDKTAISFPGEYKTLQEAVDAIAPGGTITIAAGTFEAGLTLWKPLTLRGVDREQTTLHARPQGTFAAVVIARTEGVAIEKLAVKIMDSGWSALGIWGQARVRLINRT